MNKFISFGYKHGEPPIADRIYDCRHLSNPWGDLSVRYLDGRHDKVQLWILKRDAKKVEALRHAVIDFLMNTRKVNQTIAFGCHGGTHRSVAMAEFMRDFYEGGTIETQIEHRELGTKEGSINEDHVGFGNAAAG